MRLSKKNFTKFKLNNNYIYIYIYRIEIPINNTIIELKIVKIVCAYIHI